MDSDTINVSTIYGARTDQPLVKLSIGTHEVIVPPAKARAVGAWLIEASEAAYSDAFVVRWARDMLQQKGEAPEVSLQVAVSLLRDFRQFRERGRSQGREDEAADQAEWRRQHDGEEG